jgi:GTP-binding protein Era
VGPGDRFIARELAASGTPSTIAVNKIDRLSRAPLLAALAEAGELELDAEVFPISARSGAGVVELIAHLGGMLPEAPFMFAGDAASDQPTELLVAELIREAAIRRTFQEVPHAIEVVVEDIEPPARAGGAIRVRALIWVETDSQKGILIGARGTMIKNIGTAARKEVEAALGEGVHLDLSVRVRRDWRADDSLLDRLGIG